MDFCKIYAFFSLVILIIFRLIAKWAKMKEQTVLLCTVVVGLQYFLFRTIYSMVVYQSTKFEWLPIPFLLVICVVELIRIKKRSREEQLGDG